MINSARTYGYIVLLTLWIILLCVWMGLDSIFDPAFGPTNLAFVSKPLTLIWLVVFFLLSIPITLYLARNVRDRLLVSSLLVFFFVWLFSSGITYLSTVIGEQYSSYWDAIVQLIWGVMYLALIQLVSVFYLIFYFCIAFLYCYVLGELMKKRIS